MRNGRAQMKNSHKAGDATLEDAPETKAPAHGVAVVDADGVIVSWNRTAERLTGIGREEAMGLMVSDPALSDGLGPSGKAISEAIRSGADEADLSCLTFRSENKNLLRLSFTPIKDSEGACYGGVISISESADGEKLARAMRALAHISREEAESAGLISFAGRSLSLLTETLGADGGRLWIEDPEKDGLRLTAIRGPGEDSKSRVEVISSDSRPEVPADEGVFYAAMSDASLYPALVRDGAGEGSSISVPIKVDNGGGRPLIQGGIAVRWADEKAFNAHDLRIMEEAAKRFSLVLDVMRLSREREKNRESLSSAGRVVMDFLRNSSEGVAWTQAGKIFFINDACLKMLGLEGPGKAMGMDALDFVVPSSRKKVGYLHREALNSSAPLEAQFALLAAGGKEVTVEASFSSIFPEGGSPMVQIVARDVTDKVQYRKMLEASERKYRDLVEMAYQGIVSLDAKGEITFSNGRADQILGYEKGELAGTNVLDLADDDWRPVMMELFLKKRTAAVEQEEIKLKKKGGQTIESMITAGPVKDEDGKLSGYTVFISDLSETKSLQEQLYAADKMTAIGRLAGGIAHEFNNIHAAIQGYAELLLRQPQMEEGDVNDLQAIRQLIRRASHITQQLQAFSGREKLHKESVNLAELAETNVGLVKRDFEEESIKISARSEGAPVFVKLDAGRIGQALMALMLNARDAVNEAGGDKTIVVETGKKGDKAYVKVIDGGVGIAPDAIKRIFDPFYTTKGSLGGSTIPGTGLGLSVAQAIIRDHGGHIEADSPRGGGAEVTFYLPIQADAGKVITRKVSFGEVVVGARILIVDDEIDVAQMMERALSGAGYQVEVALRGKEGVRKLMTSTYDVALIDLQMPDMQGVEILAELNLLPEHLRPIPMVVTGKTKIHEQKELDEMGVTTIIRKPFYLETLFKAVYDALAARGEKE